MIRVAIGLPRSSAIILINQLVCEEGNNPHHVLDMNRIESAIHSAFYPGSPPFVYGGIAKLVDNAAAGSVSKDQMIDWFELHKRLIED